MVEAMRRPPPVPAEAITWLESFLAGYDGAFLFVTGSIGFDDWEWGVDLFADDPIVFKKLIYEMRFDEVSAVYALFGTFYVGLRCPANRLHQLLEGELPKHAETGV